MSSEAATEAVQRQRQQRSLIRSLFLTASIREMEDAKANYDAFGQKVLQEMIDTCRKHAVDNFGQTPG